jgi:diketogulonate reductase-like aldo/keto reductase
VGQALHDSKLPREDYFVLTKVHPRDLGYDSTRRAVNDSLTRLHTHFIDAVLLHYTVCFEPVCTRAETHRTQSAGGWRQAWAALHDLLNEGIIRAIGVSNVDMNLLPDIQPPPHIVQNWMDPFHQDRAVWDWCRANGVAYMAYSALGGQWTHQRTQDAQPKANPIDTSPVIKRLADKRDASTSEIVLRWALQRRAVIIPRSSDPLHIAQNAMFVELGSPLYLSNLLTPAELRAMDMLDALVDDHSLCGAWAAAGECQKNPEYMLQSCRRSCSDVGAAAASASAQCLTPEDSNTSEL